MEETLYKCGVDVGRRYERQRILKYLAAKRAANAKVITISELKEFINEEEDEEQRIKN